MMFAASRYSIRHYYTSFKPRHFIESSLKKLPIGELVRPTKTQCPKKNYILGQAFTRFAVCVNIYTNPELSLEDRRNRTVLHQTTQEVLSKLTLTNVSSDEGVIKLLTTNEPLPKNISDALKQWKRSAPAVVEQIIGNEDSTKKTDPLQMTVDLNYSLIGWYLQTYGSKNALSFIDWLGVSVLPKSAEIWPKPDASLRPLDNAEAQHKLDRLLDGYEYIEHKLKYTFADRSYLLQPFTHPTFEANDLTPSYLGMDFVGDAITNYAITRHLFKVQRNLAANDLRNICQILHSNANYGLISTRNKFHKYLRYVDLYVQQSIPFFEAYLRKNKFRPINDCHFMDAKSFVVDVPPFVSGNFEALMAGIFFDSFMNMNSVSNAIVNLMHHDIETHCRLRTKPAYAKLYELDKRARFSEAKTIAPGQMQVILTLPSYGNTSFAGVSRDARHARWAAAKSAVIKLGNDSDLYKPTKSREILGNM